MKFVFRDNSPPLLALPECRYWGLVVLILLALGFQQPVFGQDSKLAEPEGRTKKLSVFAKVI